MQCSNGCCIIEMPMGVVYLLDVSDCRSCMLLQVANTHGPRLITELRSERERSGRLAVRHQSSVTQCLVRQSWP